MQWDVDSLDWKDYGADSIVRTILDHKHLGNGSIILMHNGAKYTPAALDAVITGLKDAGYELVPISQLLYRDNYHTAHAGTPVPDQPPPPPAPASAPAPVPWTSSPVHSAASASRKSLFAIRLPPLSLF